MLSKDLLGISLLEKEDIVAILTAAKAMKKSLLEDKVDSSILKNKTLATLFYENSTRTRISFELAAQHLGAKTVSIVTATSSIQKGESLLDNGYTLDALGVDFIVLRHSIAGAPHLLAKHTKASVLNGGDGANEHPTQALLDALTMQEHFSSFKGLKVTIIGDIKHSRVAKSNLYLLQKMGAEVTVFAPNTMLPRGIAELGARVAKDKKDALQGANVVMGLRMQLERMENGLCPSFAEYNRYFGVCDDDLKFADKAAIVLHPGPVNRNVELTSSVIDGKQSKIYDQVTSGVAVRMAVLSLLKAMQK